MSIKNKDKNYELILEGLENDTPQTLQKVKGILIGNLELSITEVQNILENYPLTIKRSNTQSDLVVHLESLKSAGARVLLLKEEDKPSNEIEFSLENPISMESLNTNKNSEPPPGEEEASAENEIEFEFDLDSISKSAAKENTEPEAAYELNLNEDTDLSLKEIEEELGESLQIAEIGNLNTKNNADSEFSLDLQPAENVLDLIESPALVNAPADTETWESDNLSKSLISHAASEGLQPAEPERNNSALLKIEESLFDLNNEPGEPVTNKDKNTDNAKKAEAIKPQINSDLKLVLEETGNNEPHVDPAAPNLAAVESKTEPAQVKNTIKTETPIIQDQSSPSVSATKKDSSPQTASALQEAEVKPAVKPVIPAKSISSSKNKKNVPTDLLIPIIVGGFLLGVVNWFYFSNKTESKSEALPKIAIPEKALENNKTEVLKPAPPEAPSHDYSGIFQNEQYSISLNLSASTDKVSNSVLEITSAKPADLTAEEIVQNVPQRIWLKKAEAENMKFEKNADLPGQFLSNLNLKLFIEQGQERQRLIGRGSLTLKISDDKAAAELIIFTNSAPENAENEILKLHKNDQGEYAVLFKKDIILNKVVKAEAPETLDVPAAAENTK